MSTQKAISANKTNNNGGSVVNAGTDYDISPVLTSRVQSSRVDNGVFASTVVLGSNTEEAVLLADFAKLHEIVARRSSRTLAGSIDTNVLLSGASVPTLTRSIHKLESLITYKQSTSFRAGHFSLYTGRYVPTPAVTTDVLAVDRAASPSRSVPGTLVFKAGAKNPVRTNYSAKTN